MGKHSTIFPKNGQGNVLSRTTKEAEPVKSNDSLQGYGIKKDVLDVTFLYIHIMR